MSAGRGRRLVSACAPKLAPVPVVTAPKFPEFIAAVGAAGAVRQPPAGISESRGWAFLQAGDLRERRARVRRGAEGGAGVLSGRDVARLRRAGAQGREGGAGALRSRARAQPAAEGCLGAGRPRPGAARRSNREADALAAFEAALAVDPSLTDLARRVEVLQVPRRSSRALRARARRRGPAGSTRRSQAYTAAIASSPDSAFLYRELAGVERQKGSNDARARALPQGGRRSIRPTPASLAQIGEMLEARGDFEGAAKAYSDVAGDRAERRPSQARLEAVRARAALARLPAEYRAIEQAPQITRARAGGARSASGSAPLLQNGQRATAALITDVRNNWAAPWIMAVARAGVMEPFANHAFQPRTVVRRIDLAQAVARLLRERRRRRPAARRSRGSGARAVHRPVGRPSGVSGRVGGGRVRRPDDRARQQRFSRRGRSPARKRSRRSSKLEALRCAAASAR